MFIYPGECDELGECNLYETLSGPNVPVMVEHHERTTESFIPNGDLLAPIQSIPYKEATIATDLGPNHLLRIVIEAKNATAIELDVSGRQTDASGQ